MKKNRTTQISRDRSHGSVVHSNRPSRVLPLLLIVLAVIVISALLVWLSGGFDNPDPDPGETATTGSTSSTTSTAATPSPEPTTTVATETTLSAEARQLMLDASGSRVLERLAKENGRFGIYFQNLVTGEVWTYQETEPFVAASSIKIGINTYLYNQMAAGEISPDELLAYDSRPYPTGDYEAGTGTIQYEPNGTEFSVRDTSGLSIRISDNCATNMIIRRLGGIDDRIIPYFESVSAEVGYRTKVTYTNYAGQSQSGRHRTCAVDLALQAVRLYSLWQQSPADYQPLIDDLTRTEFDFGIQKGIPEGVLVAHKIGTNGAYSAENDVGIVFADEPFALCVMTEMASASAAHQVQADVAAIFYDLVKSYSQD